METGSFQERCEMSKRRSAICNLSVYNYGIVRMLGNKAVTVEGCGPMSLSDYRELLTFLQNKFPHSDITHSL